MNWSKAWEGLKGIFSGIWTGLKAIAREPLEWIENKVKWVIDKVSNFKMPSWMKKTGEFFTGQSDTDNSNKPNRPNLPLIGMPMYAKGGIANKPSIFGEDGDEIAIPLKRNNPRSKALVNQADTIVNGGNKSKGDIYVTVQVQGNMIGNEEYADYVGNRIISKVKPILDTNM